MTDTVAKKTGKAKALWSNGTSTYIDIPLPFPEDLYVGTVISNKQGEIMSTDRARLRLTSIHKGRCDNVVYFELQVHNGGKVGDK